MGSQAIQIFCESPIPKSLSHCRRFVDDDYIDCRVLRWRCFSGGRSGGSRWDWDGNGNGNVNPNRRSRFSDAYSKDECDEENEFGFRSAAKQRVWWCEVDEEDDDEADDGFGILEASIGFGWVLKIFRAFGWMIPAVGISLLMGTGPNAIIMALALPLAQSAFSLAADTLWVREDETPRPKARKSKKKRPATRAPGRTRVRREKETQTQMRNESGNYKSWFEGNTVSSQNDSKDCANFGGWDELDNHVRENKDPRVAPVKQEEETRAQEMLKLSRRTKGDTPLFMRLLVAVFPFLGFWTKFF